MKERKYFIMILFRSRVVTFIESVKIKTKYCKLLQENTFNIRIFISEDLSLNNLHIIY